MIGGMLHWCHPLKGRRLSALTKVVHHVWSDGACSLLTVPLDWQAGQALPENVPDERFETPAHAMSALAEAGRSQNPTMSWYRDPAKRLPADSDGSSEGPPPA